MEPLRKLFIEANGLHSAADSLASEYETHDFLYGIVRMLKPKVILETGCYKGHATKIMAQACFMNGFGRVETCDINYDHMDSLKELEDKDVGWSLCPGETLCKMIENVDLAFLDSSGDRVAECAALNLSPKGVVVLHDSKREQYKPIWTMRPWASIWEIDTPRGIAVFQS